MLRQSLLVATALACLAIPQSVQAQCRNYSTPYYSSLPNFEDDVGFDVQSFDATNGKVIRITGDVILIDQDRLGSILARPSEMTTGVASLTFDARTIIVRGPLALEGGDLTFLAENLHFEPGGRVMLFPAMNSPNPHLSIIAERVHFSNGARRPYNLSINDKPGARLTLVAGEFDGHADPERAWLRFFDSILLNHMPVEFSVLLGDAATPDLEKSWNTSVQWPMYFAAKMRKHFARAPFESENLENLLGYIEKYEERMASWNDPVPAATLATIALSIENRSDLNGRSANFVPKQELTSQIADLRSDLEKEPFDRLISLLAHGFDEDDITQALSTARAELAASSAQLEDLQRQLGRQNTLLKQNNVDEESNRQSIEQRRYSLEQQTEADFERMRDAQSVQKWSTVAATAAVTIATAGGAAPAAAAAAGTGVSLLGEAVVAGNVGGSVDLTGVIERGQKTHAASLELARALDAAPSSYATLMSVRNGQTVLRGEPPAPGTQDNRKPYTEGQAQKELLDTLKKAGGAVSTIVAQTQEIPEALSLTDREDEDEEMKAYLVARAQLMTQRAEIVATINELLAQLVTESENNARLQSAEHDLRGARPQNDVERSRWTSNAALLWSMRIDRIADRLANIHRSLQFETGSGVTGIGNLLDYPNELQSRFDANLLNPEAVSAGASSSEMVAERLRLERDKFVVSVDESLSMVEDARRAYLNSRSEADSRRIGMVFSASDSNTVSKTFIDQVNRQIAQQVVGSTPVNEVVPVLIPVQFPIGTNVHPERLMEARVVDVRFDGGNAGVPQTLQFEIVHPNYGVMRLRDRCFLADFRTGKGDWRVFTDSISSMGSNWLSEDAEQIRIDENPPSFFAPLPARAPYALVVGGLNGISLDQLPKIESITFGFEVVQ